MQIKFTHPTSHYQKRLKQGAKKEKKLQKWSSAKGEKNILEWVKWRFDFEKVVAEVVNYLISSQCRFSFISFLFLLPQPQNAVPPSHPIKAVKD